MGKMSRGSLLKSNDLRGRNVGKWRSFKTSPTIQDPIKSSSANQDFDSASSLFECEGAKAGLVSKRVSGQSSKEKGNTESRQASRYADKQPGKQAGNHFGDECCKTRLQFTDQ